MISVIAFILTFGSAFLTDIDHSAADTVRDRGTITIELETLENYKGSIRLSLFTGKDGFPDEWEKAFTSKTVEITPELKEILLEDIPYGRYALAIIHDENENFELDTNFFGVPKEGYGFSNNARGRFGPPDYSDTEFTLETETLVLQIEMNY
ncbi:DUF2141 domain-containing protein [Rhodohalobacter sp.]|uniref:DUF2141 domain-containing protein n=1 Tax=Rhodohalobacter sp. TaxID=1974210 RepID=UPI002ACD783D|nr:DUF2141 domain-containing protein [Rhodohalobacter sp.]MDZ7756784.1 DUF2141 domain-containing protein [Rhodohalobacter sp.]